MIGIGLNIGNRVMGGFDSSASAYFAATGITGATEQAAVNTLVTSLKSAGLWSKMKAVYPFVTDNRNLLSYTEDFGNAYWTKRGFGQLATNAIAPDGSATAYKIQENNTDNNPGLVIIDGVTPNGTNTYSVWLKGDANYSFKLSTNGGTAGPTINVTTSWQLFSVTQTNLPFNGPHIGGFGSIARNSGIVLYAWHPQLELGSTATTYQPIATTQQSYISSQFKYNLVNPVDSDAAFRGVFNGGWTFSATGATPNGTNGYMDTKLVPSTVLAQDSTHLSFYSRTNSTAFTTDIGSDMNTTRYFRLRLKQPSSPISFALMNDLTTWATSDAITDSLGFYLGSRTSQTKLILQKNSSILNTSTVTDTTTLPSRNVFISALNNGSAVEFSPRQSAFASIGDGLTDTEATALYNAVNQFQVSLSRNV